MNQFTKGKWQRVRSFIVKTSKTQIAVINNDFDKTKAEAEGNALLMTVAGNTANALASQGIDAIKAIELLPELIKLIPNDVYNSNPVAIDAIYTREEQE